MSNTKNRVEESRANHEKGRTSSINQLEQLLKN